MRRQARRADRCERGRALAGGDEARGVGWKGPSAALRVVAAAWRGSRQPGAASQAKGRSPAAQLDGLDSSQRTRASDAASMCIQSNTARPRGRDQTSASFCAYAVAHPSWPNGLEAPRVMKHVRTQVLPSGTAAVPQRALSKERQTVPRPPLHEQRSTESQV